MPATPLPVSANVASLLASANFAGFRSTLGLGSAALVATSAFDAAGAAAAAQSASQPLDADLTSWAAVTRASGVDTFLATPSSANLRALITDESGTGELLFAGGALGAATATSLSTSAIYLPVGGGTTLDFRQVSDDFPYYSFGPNSATFRTICIFGAQARLKGYTVATLPAGTQGDTAFVTDALTPTFLTVVVGGGAVVTTVFYNGTNWLSQ